MADDPTALDTAALTARLAALLHEANKPETDAWDLDELYAEAGRVAEELHRRGVDSVEVARARTRSRMDAADPLRERNPEAALEIYRDVIALFGEESDPDVRADVAEALFHVGCLLDIDLDRQMEAVAAYDEVICRLATATGFHDVARLFAAMGNRATLLEDLEGPESALAAWDELLRRSRNLADQAMFEHVVLSHTVWGLVGRGRCLERLGRTAEAVSTYEEAIALGPRLPDGERDIVRDAEARLAALR